LATEPTAPALTADFPALVAVTDAAGRLQWIGGAPLSRLPATASAAGRLGELFTRPAAIFLETHVWPLLRHEGRIDEIYLTLRGADGSDLPCLVNARASAATDGPGFLWLFFPSFERLRFERELISARSATQDLAERLASTVRELAEANARLHSTAEAVSERNRELDALAHTDPLTRLGNRRALGAAFEAALGRASPDAASPRGALLVIDVDHFKAINDRWGHDAGDKALVSLAGALSGCIRRSDTAVRLGGEEFGLWLPDAGPEAAGRVAEKVHRSLRQHPMPDGLPLTVSIGVAVLDGPADASELTALLKRADEAVYAAKAAGRNRTCWADAAPR
jgi:sigma-B regulation protein RsbU (phosphoserine phosphatase)